MLSNCTPADAQHRIQSVQAHPGWPDFWPDQGKVAQMVCCSHLRAERLSRAPAEHHMPFLTSKTLPELHRNNRTTEQACTTAHARVAAIALQVLAINEGLATPP